MKINILSPLKVMGQPFTSFTSDRSAAWRALADKFGGAPDALPSLLHGTQEHCTLAARKVCTFRAQERAGFAGLKPRYGYSGVFVPGMYVAFI